MVLVLQNVTSLYHKYPQLKTRVTMIYGFWVGRQSLFGRSQTPVTLTHHRGLAEIPFRP